MTRHSWRAALTACALHAASITSMTADAQDLLVNGNFEFDQSGATAVECCEVVQSIEAGSTALPGWTIGGGGVELRGRADECVEGPADGVRWLRLGRGSASGWISQTVATEPGVRYQVRLRRWVESPGVATVPLRVTGPGFSIILLLPSDGGPCDVELAAVTACEFDALSPTATLRLEHFGGPADRAVLLDEVRLIPTTDCDDSGVPDALEILDGVLLDQDGDGIPDPCECRGDLDDDQVVDGSDLARLLGAWETDDRAADLDRDGVVGGSDLAILLGGWGRCG